ncbi:MAG: cytochrome c3 family protein [Desulfuromonadaceae bacterium]|nr:cytochrome c3 family protein [Desulfuromonadaceae bacterium]
MKIMRIARPRLILLCMMSVLILPVGLVSAAKVKEFDRSGQLIVTEKSAADLQVQPAYDIKNRPKEKIFAVPRPPFSEGAFPCSQCHKYMKPNGTRRTLTEYHTEIVLHHAEGQRWCTDCHNLLNRDKLRLVSGELVDFEESYRLCGQCHGDKFRDWKVGVHGKRTGYWNGDKQYLLCVHCHNPHDPKFKALKPLPPPDRPGKAGH